MKKYIVLSVNDNPDYLYYTPLTCWAWRKFGWEPILFYNGDLSKLSEIRLLCTEKDWIGTAFWLDKHNDYRDDTITQISRLYGSCVADGYLMTGDIDMIPLSDYWKPDLNSFTVWGHDLTGHRNYPICYIGAPTLLWNRVMNIGFNEDFNSLIKRDLDSLPQAKSNDWYKYWETDQDHITARLKAYGTGNINFITRGQGKHGFARGRVDRGNGGAGWVLDQPELIDAHMLQQTHHRQEKVNKLMELLYHVWPEGNFDWFESYTKEFRKLDNKND